MRKRFFAGTIFILIFAALCLSSCQIEGTTNGQRAKKLTTIMLDGFPNDDMDNAYTAVEEKYISYNQLVGISNYLDSVLGESNYYKMEQVGFNRKEIEYSGRYIFSIIYEISVGGSRVVTMEIAMIDGEKNGGICGISVVDTSYVDSTVNDLMPLNIVLIIYTVLTSAFMIWMFVSCWRRRIAHKRWWALLILIGGFVRFSLLENGFKFFAMLTLVLNISNVSGDVVNSAVKVTVGIPIGAIISFILRKKIKDIPDDPTPEDYDRRASSEGFKENSWL